MSEDTLLRMKGPFFGIGLTVLRCERKEGKMFSPSTQKATSIGFVHNKADDIQTEGKVALQSILQIFTIICSL